jgi:hypothetical protein
LPLRPVPWIDEVRESDFRGDVELDWACTHP